MRYEICLALSEYLLSLSCEDIVLDKRVQLITGEI